ncbi:MAG: glutathione S-transferase family protein [Myxococcota bacterium]
MKFYDFSLSAHAHRPRALLQILGVPFETVWVDLAGGEHKKAPFLALNPLGQVPVLEDGDVVVRDSAAILTYLALRYDPARTWLPEDLVAQANVQSWLSVSVKELYEGPFLARVARVFGAPIDYDKAVANAHQVFSELFEPHLATREWLVGTSPTIADLANYAGVAAAREGDIDLSGYPNLLAWLERVEAIPGVDPMAKS